MRRALVVGHLRMTAALREASARGSDRGDVPGWVLVTIMTAGLVASLWAIAGDRLTSMFGAAMDSVVGGP